MRAIVLFFGVLLSSFALSQQNQLKNVTDELFIYMHAGPSNQYKIIGSVNAGTQVQHIQTNQETGYAEIVDDRNRQGWVDAKFLSDEQSKSQVIEQLQQQLLEANEIINQLQSNKNEEQIAVLTEQLESAKQRVNVLTHENAQLQQTIIAKDESLQMEWLIRGAGVIIVGIVIGVILTNLPRRRQRADKWM